MDRGEGAMDSDRTLLSDDYLEEFEGLETPSESIKTLMIIIMADVARPYYSGCTLSFLVLYIINFDFEEPQDT